MGTHTRTHTSVIRSTIAKKFTFCAAHHLTDDESPCANVHGHNFAVWVHVAGELRLGGSDDGMIVPFEDLKRAWAAIEPKIDHQDLNEVLNMARPTTERVAIWLLNEFRGAGAPVGRVEVYETENNVAVAEWIEPTDG